MQSNQEKAIIEAILFAAGRPVTKNEIMLALEISEDEIEKIIANMQEEYNQENRGIELIKINNSYQLCTKKELYEYVYPILDKRTKPNLSTASLETLAIIAYNQPITRNQIDEIRGVSSTHILRKLLIKDLIQDCGRSDLPGKPILYSTTPHFLDYFGLSNINELPALEISNSDESKEEDLFQTRYKEN